MDIPLTTDLVGLVFLLGGGLPGIEIGLHLAAFLHHLLGRLGLGHAVLQLKLSLVLLHVLFDFLLLFLCNISVAR